MLLLLTVSFITLILVDLGPSPALTILGEQATAEEVAEVERELGLDRPIIVRYVNWLGDAVTGDLGRSFRSQQPVWETITSRLPVTVQLAVTAQLMAIVVAVPMAILTAFRAGRRVDSTWRAFSSFLISCPPFVTGILLAYVFGVVYGVFPVTGWNSISDGLGANLQTVFLPALTLALSEIAIYSRTLRTDLIATLQHDYILSARAKGLSTGYILFRHALRPSSFSIITLLGFSFGRLIAGAVVVETIFALPGIGQLAVQSISAGDLVMVQGVVLLVALSYVVINSVLDLLYVYLDPRVRHRSRSR